MQKLLVARSAGFRLRVVARIGSGQTKRLTEWTRIAASTLHPLPGETGFAITVTSSFASDKVNRH